LGVSEGVLAKVDTMIIEIHASWCNESAVRDILNREFGCVLDLSAPNTPYPVLLASRQPLAGY